MLRIKVQARKNSSHFVRDLSVSMPMNKKNEIKKNEMFLIRTKQHLSLKIEQVIHF